ncbi:hypothetical protein [Mesorhizobium qingshengii]|uniref:Uncharacterized protein n=1 Tax=Mesorhizobium qingshengii TaxID=1165689 RepID=A0A1G5V072_9HYPH|nr:hypothetical protein [Mesorhizobium qingshengii]SDA39028.1 hypothetical protein SAMN02927914_00100 [Mesorhizobium qingshengii]
MTLTAYYSAGTATLTNGSTAVVGIGTAWTTNNLAPGDQIETDSGLRATIASIDGPTTLTLDKNFVGTTQTAAPYKIWRTFDAQYLMEGARNAFNLLGSGSIAALAELAGLADNGMYFTAPGVLALFSLTAAGRALLGDATFADMRTTLGIATDLDAVRKRGTVRAATTANIAIATALNNADVLDGVALATGDLVLVKNQTAPAENGIYVVGAVPARSGEYDTYNEHAGALILIQEGTTLADTLWSCTSDVGGVLDTTAIVFTQMASVPNDSVTNAKLANMANATIKGRTTAGTGDPEDLTMAQLKALLLSSTVIREVLTANRTYYVRTDGNDGNTGLVNNSGGAFLTIQKAIDTAATLDLSIYSVTIQCGTGTGGTSGINLKSFVGGGTITLQGDTGTPSNVTIATTSANCINALGIIGKYTITGFKFAATTSGYAISAGGASKIDLGVVEFGACASGHIDAEQQAIVTFLNNYTISGGGTRHWFTTTGALIQCTGKTVTLTGTPAFSSGFLIASRDGGALISSNTFSGSATGSRYSVSYTAWADVAGAGASYLPGDAAGSTSSGGTYA